MSELMLAPFATADLLAVIARVSLGCIFLAAGLTKWPRRMTTKTVIIGLGAPNGIASLVASALPIVEIVVGVLLVTNHLIGISSIVASILMVLFTITVIAVLRSGRQVTCNCFGGLSVSPISSWTLFRNLALLAMSIWVFSTHPLATGTVLQEIGARQRVSPTFVASFLVIMVVLCAHVVAIVRLTRLQNGILTRLTALEEAGMSAETRPSGTATEARRNLGMRIPPYAVTDPDNAGHQLSEFLRDERDLVLFFVAPTCQSCVDLLRDAHRWQQELRDRVHIVVIVRATHRDWAELSAVNSVYFERDGEVSRSLGVHGTPAAVVINHRGEVVRHAVFGHAAIADAVIEASSQPDNPGDARMRLGGQKAVSA